MLKHHSPFTVDHLPERKVAAPNIETIVSLSKRRGFVFPSSEIYGGLGSAWDYGPLGTELTNNIKRAWWRWLVYERDDIEGLDSSIILNRLVWKYSGHEATFNDMLIDCLECKKRWREDKLETIQVSRRLPASAEIESAYADNPQPASDDSTVQQRVYVCPNC